MNRLMIIGNVTRDPDTRTVRTQAGESQVCSFTVAVNNRHGDQDSTFFRVSTWRKLAENCNLYVHKGSKVAVVGEVSCRTYQANNGETRASLEVNASEVEFLSPRNNQGDSDDTEFVDHPQKKMAPAPAPQYTQQNMMTPVQDESLPF